MAEPIDLVPLPDFRPPRLPGSLTVRATHDEVIDAAAFDLVMHSRNCIRAFGDFHVAVSVSPGIEPLLLRLMYDPALRDISWKRAHVWLLDESADGPSRAQSLRELFIPHSDIPDEQLHMLDCSPAAAASYTREIRETLEWREKGHDRLDFALMEVDADGTIPVAPDDHAGLFAAARPGGVAMTESLINASRFVALLAAGDAMAPTIRTLEREWAAAHGPSADEPTRGALRLRLLGGELRWYVDHAACGVPSSPAPHEANRLDRTGP